MRLFSAAKTGERPTRSWESEFNRVYPGLNNEVRDFGDGLTVRHHCDTHPVSWDVVYRTTGLRSVEEYAWLHATRPNCESGFWKKADASCWVSEKDHAERQADQWIGGYSPLVTF
ncbi:hypothetical protein BDW62DRAFT_189733 [Aspergillus aurantiobrunneus]